MTMISVFSLLAAGLCAWLGIMLDDSELMGLAVVFGVLAAVGFVSAGGQKKIDHEIENGKIQYRTGHGLGALWAIVGIIFLCGFLMFAVNAGLLG